MGKGRKATRPTRVFRLQSRNSCNLNCSCFEESEQGAHRIVLEVWREGHGEDRGRSTADAEQEHPQLQRP